ncbi:MAG: fatty acid desaturase [Bauldia sp.]
MSRFRVEAPTVALAVAIYGGWIVVTLAWRFIPWPLLVLAGGWLTAWQSSLQHETIHGHPTRFRALNDAIGWPPLSLWLPYPIYRASHLRHHRDERLTDPIEDPESAYVTPELWSRVGPLGRAILAANTTLIGRLLIGPAIMIGAFVGSEVLALARGDYRHGGIWARHLLGVAAVLVWVVAVCGMPFWLYLVAFVYPGAALIRLRAYAEHRWSEEVAHRTAIVERGGLFGILFLNNNLHALHHSRPTIPWYDLPAAYDHERRSLVSRNGGLVYRGYFDVARRFLFRPHHDPVHPEQNSRQARISGGDRGSLVSQDRVVVAFWKDREATEAEDFPRFGQSWRYHGGFQRLP